MKTPAIPMPSFHRILVATDLSRASCAAFQVALNLCGELGAHLSALHVLEAASAGVPEAGIRQRRHKSIRERAQGCLDELLERAREVGVPCETFMESGVASQTILETIASKKIDLAVLGTDGLRGFERFISGSTAEEVLRKAPCPVMTVGPRIQDAAANIVGPIVFATDFDLTAMDAIRYAASFSQATGSSLHFVHVLPRTHGDAAPSQGIPHAMTEALQHLETTRLPPICVTIHSNEISNAIVDYARQERAKLIVLGVRRASMVASHAPARVAYRIITEAPCPVMTMAF